MDNNESRRSLIMLRPMTRGCSGHARLEIRTLTGNMNIVLSSARNARDIHAALVGMRRGDYFAVPLGTLRSDLRGQSGLNVNFDPRSINGMPLSMYSLIVLVDTGGGECRIICGGNLKNSLDIDWVKAREAVCALYAPDDAADTLPDRDENIPVPLIQAESVEDAQEVGEETSETPDNSDEEENADEDSEEPLFFSFSDVEDTDDEQGDPEDTSFIDWDSARSDSVNLSGVNDMPGLNIGTILRKFTRAGWKFARVSLPEGSQATYSYVGMPDTATAPDEICCAIPGYFSPEPPLGLDDYEWSGGSGEGWWIKCYIPRP